jgi:4-diphosphocytidyl-2-C-methyl-D-erythritol kinase
MSLRSLHDLPAPAKLNLFLHVVGRRADGYHLLQSVFVPIDWADRLHVERRDDGRLVRHDLGPALPADDLVLRAARLLQQATGCTLGADLHVDKQVPWGAGMGGGSSDAATTLLALNRLWSLGLRRAELQALGLKLGADVPFFLGGRPAFVEGIGEQLTPIDLPQMWLGVLKPPTPVDTAHAFADPLLVRDTDPVILSGFPQGDSPVAEVSGAGTLRAAPSGAPVPAAGAVLTAPQVVEGFGRNDLQAVAVRRHPEVVQALDLMQRCFGNARMTGSGSAVFSRAGTGAEPSRAMPQVETAGWIGRMCRSLEAHPLVGWVED